MRCRVCRGCAEAVGITRSASNHVKPRWEYELDHKRAEACNVLIRQYLVLGILYRRWVFAVGNGKKPADELLDIIALSLAIA